MIFRLDPPIWLITPKGQALCHFLIDRGIEFDNEYVCFHDNGEIWNWMNYDVRVAKNLTIGRETLTPITRSMKMAKKPKYEGSAADKRVDARESKKRGMSMKQWEGSAADERMDKIAARKKKL